ncbi:hypothetical protein OE88DRAFT_226196 [Heliocybe sulcata]|uniref:F-box domain-containing protein n=1 Tax=Heliocybe sulcata TaxID=5364 RepID=A0A5C3N282_9AGAM|nr:hypothetical protein OE88DRAFT_226196 [Heliocybe sulcata]
MISLVTLPKDVHFDLVMCPALALEDLLSLLSTCKTFRPFMDYRILWLTVLDRRRRENLPIPHPYAGSLTLLDTKTLKQKAFHACRFDRNWRSDHLRISGRRTIMNVKLPGKRPQILFIISGTPMVALFYRDSGSAYIWDTASCKALASLRIGYRECRMAGLPYEQEGTYTAAFFAYNVSNTEELREDDNERVPRYSVELLVLRCNYSNPQAVKLKRIWGQGEMGNRRMFSASVYQDLVVWHSGIDDPSADEHSVVIRVCNMLTDASIVATVPDAKSAHSPSLYFHHGNLYVVVVAKANSAIRIHYCSEHDLPYHSNQVSDINGLLMLGKYDLDVDSGPIVSFFAPVATEQELLFPALVEGDWDYEDHTHIRVTLAYLTIQNPDEITESSLPTCTSYDKQIRGSGVKCDRSVRLSAKSSTGKHALGMTVYAKGGEDMTRVSAHPDFRGVIIMEDLTYPLFYLRLVHFDTKRRRIVVKNMEMPPDIRSNELDLSSIVFDDCRGVVYARPGLKALPEYGQLIAIPYA